MNNEKTGTTKLLAIDLDGTLLKDDLTISAANLAGLQKVKDAGVTIAIATGRTLPSTMSVVEQYDFYAYSICHNGGLIYDHGAERNLYVNGMDTETVGKIIDFCLRENQALYVRGLDLWGLVGYDEYAEHFARLQNYPLTAVTEASQLENVEIVSLVSVREEGKLKEFMERNELPVACTISGPNNMDIMARGVNKGQALELLAKKLGIEKDEIISIGNHFNDIEMFQFSRIGIAMPNSPRQVREAADHVTTNSNNDDGVLEVLETFLL